MKKINNKMAVMILKNKKCNLKISSKRSDDEKWGWAEEGGKIEEKK